MKKNTMMRIASFLLIAVLLSTSAISGTYAKYVTQGSGTDSARVAKWGVEISGIASDLFAETYAKDSATDIANTVVANEKVVAPGTKNDEGVTFSLTGTPEVAVKIDFVLTCDADVVLPAGSYTDWTQAPYTDTFTLDDEYTPVVFTLKSGEYTVATGTLSDIKTALENKNAEYPAGTDLSQIFDASCTGTYTLTWAWVYDGNDQADTLLGNLAAGNQDAIAGASTEIDFTISITATQID